MTWNFKVEGSNRAEVVNALTDEAMRHRPQTPVDQVLGVAALAMNGMPDDSIKSVATFGHRNTDGTGNFSLSVNC